MVRVRVEVRVKMRVRVRVKVKKFLTNFSTANKKINPEKMKLCASLSYILLTFIEHIFNI